MLSLLNEIWARELGDLVRHEILVAIDVPGAGQRYLTFSSFNVLVDHEAATVKIEDEFDPERESVIGLRAFAAPLRDSGPLSRPTQMSGTEGESSMPLDTWLPATKLQRL
ncbi:hypothetical protein [Marmoricola sp. RAF53]|uniref:hypothetical protein n=1 Tax=Marmoricola sp. RAF53 TaxID=3233059 RepID=UPI003F9A713C